MLVLDEWLLTPERAAIHLPSAAAVIADVHLGYGEARRRGGDAVPLADAATVLAPLRPLLEQHAVRQLVIAGDLFEAGTHTELAGELLAWCARARIDLAVVPGNHDITNAIGFYKPMQPLTDPTSMVKIYNLMLQPAQHHY